MKRFLVLIILIMFLLPSALYADEQVNYEEDNIETFTERGEVLEIIADANEDENTDEFSVSSQIVKIKVLTGKYKNEEFVIENNISGNIAFDIIVEKGDKVLLFIEEGLDQGPTIYISDFIRDTYLYYIFIAFAILLIVIGGIKGIKSLVTLSITIAVIFKIMLPLLLKGFNPIWLTINCALGITIITFLIIGGLNIKSVSAIIGTLGGVLFAGFLAYFIGITANLTGLSSEEASMLLYIPQNMQFDFRGLLFAGIIIGTLGAVMDVAMSVSSSMYEIRELNPEISPKELMKSGLNVGKDIMGTMSNTLILAYTGSSVPLLLLFMAYETSIVKILNLDLIATEVVRSFIGSIGLILTIPITALAAGLILKHKKQS